MVNPFLYSLKCFWIRSRHWEYWPMWLVYAPVFFYYAYLALKARSFFFFQAANPGIENGGMFFESKWRIFQSLPPGSFPTTIFVSQTTSVPDIMERMHHAQLNYPVVAKPDRGERGWAVEILHNNRDLVAYRKKVPVDTLIQSYVDYPVELSVFYVKLPHEKSGKITSLTGKKLLTVIGDGQSSLLTLLLKNQRAYLQYKRLVAKQMLPFDSIPALNKEVLLVPQGNHALGAEFIDLTSHISPALNKVFNDLSQQIDGFYFGRFDLRCASLSALQDGHSFSILELNGAGAEPAHVYQPGFSFFKAQKVLAEHYKYLYQASKANHEMGVPYMTYPAFKQLRMAQQQYREQVKLA